MGTIEADDAPADYPPTGRTRVKRLHERARYDRDAVHAILDAGLLCHVGYVIDGQPYVTPTAYWREGEHVYWHGSSASRMLRHLKQRPRVCFTVALMDGLVLARSGFHTSVNRSEEHTSELQSLMRISSAVFCLKKKKTHTRI